MKMDQNNNRKLARRHLIFYLRVFDNKTGDLLGYLADITTEGLMIMSEQPIPSNQAYELKIDVHSQLTQEKSIVLTATSLWSKKSLNPDIYDSGFAINELSTDAYRAVSHIIHEMGFNE